MTVMETQKTCDAECAAKGLAMDRRCRVCQGRARLADQARAVQQVRDGAALPDECSRELPVAPARGRVAPFKDVRMMVRGDDVDVVEVAYRAGCPGRVRDVFDVMTDQASRRRASAAPFTVAQVAAGRAYRALVERVNSSGVKCSSAFDAGGGGQGRVDFMDLYMRDTERLAAMRAAIGDGVAKDTWQRVDAVAGGIKVGDAQLRHVGRKLITVRALVDAVCLSDQALSAVLKAHGWSTAGKNRMTLKRALCAALDRLDGV